MTYILSEELIKIQPKGLVTIPKKFRLKLGLQENGLVRLKEEKGKLILEPVRTLPYPVRSYTPQDLREFFELDKKETARLKKKGLTG